MAMRFTDVDALIIGGGPGGAMSALKLARLGWRTMLVERGTRNRHKTCGHCVNRRAMEALRREGLLSAVTANAAGNARIFRLHGLDGSSVETSLPIARDSDAGAGLVIDRSRLDQLLRDRAVEAGVMVSQPASARVESIGNDGAIVRVATADRTFSVRARLLVGADGVGSAVARAAGLIATRSAGRKFGFSFDVCNNGESRRIDRDAVEMFLVPGGYLGLVGHGLDRLHAAALLDGRRTDAHQPLAFVRRAVEFHDRLRQLGLDRMNADDLQHLKAIGPMPWRPRNVSCSIGEAHIALVGDAAGYVEPFTGEGIGWALQSADLLEQCAATCEPGRWMARASREYSRLWRRHIGRRQRLCAAIAWTLERPRLAEIIVRLAARLPRLAERVAMEVVTA